MHIHLAVAAESTQTLQALPIFFCVLPFCVFFVRTNKNNKVGSCRKKLFERSTETSFLIARLTVVLHLSFEYTVFLFPIQFFPFFCCYFTALLFACVLLCRSSVYFKRFLLVFLGMQSDGTVKINCEK